MHTRYQTRTLAPGAECWMPHKPPQICRCIIGAHIQIRETIPGVTKLPFEKVLVLREKGDAANSMKNRQNLWILHSKKADFAANLTEGNSPSAKKSCLILGEVLVQQIHAAANAEPLNMASVNRPRLSSSAC